MSPRLSLLVELPRSGDATGASISGLRFCDVELVVASDDSRLDHWPDVVRVAPGPGALDRALSAATAPVVAVADPWGIVVGPKLDALLSAVCGEGGAGVAYSDENAAGVELRKPGWSPMFLRHFNYLGRLTVLPRSLALAAGGFGAEPSAEATHRLLLRIADGGVPVQHVPEIAYERPLSEPPPSSPMVEPLSVEPGPVSVLMPTAGSMAEDGREPAYLALRALEAVRRAADGLDVEVICVAGPEADRAAMTAVADAADGMATIVVDQYPFNFSRRMNLAAAMGRGEVVVWLNDDVERYGDDSWLRRIAQLAMVDDIGAVGVKLLYPDATVQTAGVRFVAGLPKHVGVGAPADLPGPLRAFVTPREQVAVTGAVLATRRSIFDAVGGLTEALPVNFGDVDYCLKVQARGYRVVLDPTVSLLHHESASRPPGIVSPEEFTELHERWPMVKDSFWPWADEPDTQHRSTLNGQHS